MALRCDLIIRDATIFDGTGAPRRRGDVGVTGDRIVAVGGFYREDSPPAPFPPRWCQNVKLAGPDWSSTVPTAAAFFTGIVGVYRDPDGIED